MSDEEDESVSEGFSASEDEWKPGKNVRDGESSDDDDSDFEEISDPNSSGAKAQPAINRKRDPGKSQLRVKIDGGGVAKKRKPMGQSLRSRLYNKYRPPPKTFPSPNSGNNSPTASTSRTASKNELTPNEVGYGGHNDDNEDDGSSSESSIGNHLVNPADLDLCSSFFSNKDKSTDDVVPPVFDCNAGIEQLSGSDAEDNNEMCSDTDKTSKAFDFRNLLENANSLERAKEQIAKRAEKSKAKITTNTTTKSSKSKANASDDVTKLLALGENLNQKHDLGAEEDDEDDDDDAADVRGPSKLSKTKSTRIKRHTKTRPASQILAADAGGDSDDSDWEEVADKNQSRYDPATNEDLQVVVSTSKKKMTKEEKTQQELDMAFKRRLNRDLKERQLLLHKASLLFLFARSYNYNRFLNDLTLMRTAVQLLPSRNAYPRDTGTDLKYFQSFLTWFKATVKLNSPNLYADQSIVGKTWIDIKEELLAQIKKKEARCKQDMIFILIALLRGMGIQCRLVVNLQPLPLKPSQQDLVAIKLKVDVEKKKPKDKKDLTSTVKLRTDDAVKSAETKSSSTIQKSEKNKTQQKDEKKQDQNSKKKSEMTLCEKLDKNLEAIQEEIREERQQATKRSTRSKKDIPDKNINMTAKDEKEKEKKTNLTLQEKLNRNFDAIREEVEEEKRIAKRSTRTKKDTKSEKTENPSETNSQHEKRATNKLKRSKADEVDAGKEVVKPKKMKSNEKNLSADTATEDSGIHLERSNKEFNSSQEENKEVPKIVVENEEPNKKRGRTTNPKTSGAVKTEKRSLSRSVSPRPLISTEFLKSPTYKKKFSPEPEAKKKNTKKQSTSKAVADKAKISSKFLEQPPKTRVLRSRQNSNIKEPGKNALNIPQLDGADDELEKAHARSQRTKKRTNSKQQKNNDSDEDFQPSPTKQGKRAPNFPKVVQNLRKDRRVLSTDNDTDAGSPSKSGVKKGQEADIWLEVWSDVENQWMCMDIFRGKVNEEDSIRKSASSSLAYVFAFQNDLSLKDVTARYCPHWATTIRKSRVDKFWLEDAISKYYGKRTERDIREDHELRYIHEQKPMPTAISDFKDHPLYALERHLLKYQAIYPPNAPTLGFTSRKEPIYSRDCVHLLHAREIWLKEARTVKLGEQPYKIVLRPKWDRLTRTILKAQPLELFGYWQTEDYEPPTAENGLVPRNAYGNVELFKDCMLPKKTVHLKLPGLMRICKKLNIDCANAVVGFDFHQGYCHAMYDGVVVCEEFGDQVTAAWYQDQEEQDRKEQEKYEARVYGNWKKLIKGLIIRERIKMKYNM